MGRCRQYPLCRTFLTHCALIQDEDAVRDGRDEAEIMGDEEQGDAELIAETEE